MGPGRPSEDRGPHDTPPPIPPASRPRRRRARRALAGAGLLVAAVAWSGCGDDDARAQDAVPTIEVVVGGEAEYRFDVPGSVDAGPVRIDLTNEGIEPHHAQVLRLHDDATVDDLQAALEEGGPPAALGVGTFVGGTALVAPDGEASRADAVVDLDEGRHVLLCFVPDASGTPHVAHGMVQAFDVVDGGDPAPAPAADGTVGLADFRFELPPAIDGDEVLEVENLATEEAHELVVARLEGDAGVDDVRRALDEGRPIPATGVGGMQALLPGDVQHLALDLDPGRYVLFCAVTTRDGTPHHRLGMATEVTVP